MILGRVDLNILNILQNPAGLLNKNPEFSSLFNDLLKSFFKNDELTPDSLTFLLSEIIPVLLPLRSEQKSAEFQPILSELEASDFPLQLEFQSEQKYITFLQPIFSNLINQTCSILSQSKPLKLLQDFVSQKNENLCWVLNKIQIPLQTSSDKTPIKTSDTYDKMPIKISDTYELKKEQSEISEKFSQFEKEPLLESAVSFQSSLRFCHPENEKNSFSETLIVQPIQNKTAEKTRDDRISLPKTNVFPDSINNHTHKIPDKIELPVTRLNEVSDIMLKTIASSRKTITVQLEPPELGTILLRLSMESEGIKAHMRVDSPNVKEMLAGLIPEIKSNLEATGVKINDFILDLKKDNQAYSDSYNGQGQKKYNGNQKFFEYFA
uniref:Flagellar hook-length control protein FliK n=1 Tax=Thermodesulfovibrio aggregans TaxID=86166 RepID=A0A7C4EN83_9BACT